MIREPVEIETHPLNQEDIVYYIFSFLLKKELVQVAKVCSQWNMISSSSPQWKRIHLYTKDVTKKIFQVIQDDVPPVIIGHYSGANLIELTYEFDGTNDDNFLNLIQQCKNIQTLRLLGNSNFDFSRCGPFVEDGKLMINEQVQDKNLFCFSKNIFNIYLAGLRNLDVRGFVTRKARETVIWIESLMPQLESLKLGWIFESTSLKFLRPSWHINLIYFHIDALNASKSTIDLAPRQLREFWMVGFSQGINCGSLQEFFAPCTQLSNLNLCCGYYLFNEEEESFQFFEQLTFTNNVVVDLNLRATELCDNSLIRIAENCSNLRRINVGCTQVTKKSISILLDYCTLTDLDLCYCENIYSIGSDETLELMSKIAKKCSTNLRMLGLGGFQSLLDDAFQIILSNCCNILHLGIGGCKSLTSLSFENIVKYIGNTLKNLNAHNLLQIPEPSWLLLLGGCIKLDIVQAEDNPQLNQTLFSNYRIHETEEW